jgi:hypothetical protein
LSFVGCTISVSTIRDCLNVFYLLESLATGFLVPIISLVMTLLGWPSIMSLPAWYTPACDCGSTLSSSLPGGSKIVQASEYDDQRA